MNGNKWQKMFDAMKNGILFCIYFFPLALFLAVLERLSDLSLSFFLVHIQGVLPFIVVGFFRFIFSFGLWIVFLSVLSSFYIKMKHSYPQLFFTVAR